MLSCTVGVSYSEDCLNKDLRNFVENYIKDVDRRLVLSETSDIVPVTPFYALYFFDKNYISHLTVWASAYYPSVWMLDDDTIKHPNYCFELHVPALSNGGDTLKRYLIIMDYEEGRDLYAGCNINRDLYVKLHSMEPFMIYDGPIYARTYKYSIEKGRAHFEQCDTLIADSLREDFVEYERFQQQSAKDGYEKSVEEYESYKAGTKYDKEKLTELQQEMEWRKKQMEKTGIFLLR
jgi:hypothetical protein